MVLSSQIGVTFVETSCNMWGFPVGVGSINNIFNCRSMRENCIPTLLSNAINTFLVMCLMLVCFVMQFVNDTINTLVWEKKSDKAINRLISVK